MYNTFDVTINLASNEGFGLATAESLSAGTPIICNKTGGLLDQITDECEWAIGVEPKIRKLSGDGTTHYLYEDFVCTSDVAKAMLSLHSKSQKERLNMGKTGREYIIKNFSIDNMNSLISNLIDQTIKDFLPIRELKIKKL